MKTVALVPIKGNSKRIKNKNIKNVFGKPLFAYLLDKIHNCNFDEVYVDTDIEQVKKYAKKNRLNILHISYSLDIGGAARAAHRIHLSLIKSNVNSKILTIKKWVDNDF